MWLIKHVYSPVSPSIKELISKFLVTFVKDQNFRKRLQRNVDADIFETKHDEYKMVWTDKFQNKVKFALNIYYSSSRLRSSFGRTLYIILV